MTKVAVWCRHEGDNIIGIGKDIPWDVPSDVRKFHKIVSGSVIVVGRKTYETLPPSFNDEQILVLTSNPDYELKNPKKHQIVSKLSLLKELEEDIYISGGAKVYEDFLNGGSKLMPDIIVDCVFHGTLAKLEGEPVNISSCIESMSKKYFKISSDYVQDNVTTTIYIKRGDFVEQSVLKRLLSIIESDN